MFLAFDVETVVQSLIIDFRAVTIIGCLVSMSTAIIPMFFGHPMLTHRWIYYVPTISEIHLSSVTLFNSGILHSSRIYCNNHACDKW